MGLKSETTGHTPGPWAIFHTGSINQIVPAMRPGMIADLIDNEANAYLIAAAPDLLEALKGVMRVADRATVEFDAARAAIAKAEATP